MDEPIVNNPPSVGGENAIGNLRPETPSEASRQAALASKWDALEGQGNKPQSANKPSSKDEIDLETGDPVSSKPQEKVEDKGNKPSTIKPEDVTFEDKVEKEEEVEVEDDKLREELSKDADNKREFPNDKRDYSQFDPDDVPALRRLPNRIFARLSQSLLEKKQLKESVDKVTKDYEQVKSGKLPDSWAEHPHAYQLTDQYRALTQELELDNFEIQHYTNQLRQVKAGQDWYLIEGYDKQGQPQFRKIEASKDGSPDVNAEVNISQELNRIGQLKVVRQQHIGQLQNNHLLGHQRSVAQVKEAENKFFPSYVDPSKIPTEVKQSIDLCYKAIPPQFQNHPLAGIVTKAYAYIYEGHKKIQELNKKIAMLEGKGEDRRKAGPSPRELSTTAGGGRNGILSAEMFED